MNRKHVLIMLACCLLPIVGLVLIAIFKIPTSVVLWGAMILICPLSHLLMMKYMGHDHDASHSTNRLVTPTRDNMPHSPGDTTANWPADTKAEIIER